MATTRTFSAALNEYAPDNMFREELLKRDYLLNKVQKNDKWLGGNYIVPFEGGQASSVSFGSLTDSTDVAESSFVRGQVSAYKEVWGTLKFNYTDLVQHGKFSEQNLLRLLPDQVENFMQYMKEQISQNLLGNSYFASLTANGDTNGTGVLDVDRVERFTIGQKFTLDDDDTAQVELYVIAINLNTSRVTVSDSRGGSAFSVSGYTTAQNARCYYAGVLVAGTVTNNFQSLTNALLSSANGGGATLHGQTKTTYPYLQAINVDGSSINSANILEKIFDAYTDVRKKARGNASTILMSFKNLGSCMKLIETQKGGFKVTPTATKASLYGWTEIEITSVKGNLTIVGIQEMDDSEILFIDWSALEFASNGMFRKVKDPNGQQEYFPVRATTGIYYLVDIALFGELIVKAPSKCGVLYGISY